LPARPPRGGRARGTDEIQRMLKLTGVEEMLVPDDLTPPTTPR
jgi:hypothetical protein